MFRARLGARAGRVHSQWPSARRRKESSSDLLRHFAYDADLVARAGEAPLDVWAMRTELGMGGEP